jgi:hypothetical protein
MQATSSPSAAPTEVRHGLPPRRGESSAEDNVWLADGIQRLVETAPSLDALRTHRLHLAAARLWQSRGCTVPADLLSEVRVGAVRAMLARFILGKARSAYGGALMLMKGPEAAVHYPFPSDRPFRDLDLLADDPPAAQRALIAAGFVERAEPGRYSRHFHLSPLMWPGAPLPIEVHHRPSQPDWLAPVSGESIFRIGVPSATGAPGVLAPEPSAHAVLLVAHAWKHDPMGNMGQLLDAAAVLASADRRRASALAKAWGWEGMWKTSLAVIDSVLRGTRRPLALNVWARHLLELRERTVLENHITRLAGPIWSLPADEIPHAVCCALHHTATPKSDEDWMAQLRRSCLAIAHAFRPGSEHEQSRIDHAR